MANKTRLQLTSVTD